MKIYTTPTHITSRQCEIDRRYGRTVHISEPTGSLFLNATNKQIWLQLEKLSNPAFGGTGRVQAKEYLAGLLVAYEEATGTPWSMEAVA